ncbi:MAG: radical SAM protein [Candidatus Omnitrophica bacterium]|nr:radical SAM protein [Candidatus Omnitrophota bacterium]
MTPLYLKAYNTGKLKKTTEKLWQLLKCCCLCPRKCKVNRLKDERGYCKTGFSAGVYSYMPHHGEEPPISGSRGSGTIFFSHCNMRCVYCENYKFSQVDTKTQDATVEELANIMLKLQKLSCHNINFVTPTHVIPQILKALMIAIEEGLTIPLVYNSSGYELPEVIRLLDGIIDIYLPDLRYASDEMAIKYSNAPNYSFYSKNSIKEMYRQTGIAKFNEEGLITGGVIIRHLVLPNNISGTKEIMEFIAKEISQETYISLMSQYLPCYKASDFPELNRRISRKEYENAYVAMSSAGLYNGWIQEEYGQEELAGINLPPSVK